MKECCHMGQLNQFTTNPDSKCSTAPFKLRLVKFQSHWPGSQAPETFSVRKTECNCMLYQGSKKQEKERGKEGLLRT